MILAFIFLLYFYTPSKISVAALYPNPLQKLPLNIPMPFIQKYRIVWAHPSMCSHKRCFFIIIVFSNKLATLNHNLQNTTLPMTTTLRIHYLLIFPTWEIHYQPKTTAARTRLNYPQPKTTDHIVIPLFY